jgi:hypothetical protein
LARTRIAWHVLPCASGLLLQFLPILDGSPP